VDTATSISLNTDNVAEESSQRPQAS